MAQRSLHNSYRQHQQYLQQQYLERPRVNSYGPDRQHLPRHQGNTHTPAHAQPQPLHQPPHELPTRTRGTSPPQSRTHIQQRCRYTQQAYPLPPQQRNSYTTPQARSDHSLPTPPHIQPPDFASNALWIPAHSPPPPPPAPPCRQAYSSNRVSPPSYDQSQHSQQRQTWEAHRWSSQNIPLKQQQQQQYCHTNTYQPLRSNTALPPPPPLVGLLPQPPPPPPTPQQWSPPLQPLPPPPPMNGRGHPQEHPHYSQLQQPHPPRKADHLSQSRYAPTAGAVDLYSANCRHHETSFISAASTHRSQPPAPLLPAPPLPAPPPPPNFRPATTMPLVERAQYQYWR